MIKRKVYINEILNFLGDEVLRVIGDIDGVFIDNIADVKHTNNKTLDWIAPNNPNKQKIVESSIAKVILVDKDIVYNEVLESIGKILIVANNPKTALAKVGNEFFVKKEEPFIHPTAIIDPEAQIGKDVYIGPYSVIGRVVIGDDCHIDSNVKLYDDVIIGNHCNIKSGAVIGGAGFGFQKDENGYLFRFPQVGSVSLGDNVEIGANTCIDRGALSVTTIGNNTKIDNLCHIGHNVQIGENVEITCGCILGGSSKIGDNVWLSLNTIVKDGIQIGNDVFVGMRVTVSKNTQDNETLWVKENIKRLDFKI